MLLISILFQATLCDFLFVNSITFLYYSFSSPSESYIRRLRIVASSERLHDNRHFVSHCTFATMNADSFAPKDFIQNFDTIPSSASPISTPPTLSQFVTKDVIQRNRSVNFEIDLQLNIRQRRWEEAKILLSSLKTFITSESSGRRRTVLYIILETCRRTGQIEYIVPLLLAIPKTVITDLIKSNSFRLVNDTKATDMKLNVLIIFHMSSVVTT